MTTHFITFRDLTVSQYYHIFERASFLKKERRSGQYRLDHLKGRAVGVFFNKHSTRTRVSFECAINELGGQPIIMNLNDSQFSRGEPLSHSARVLSGYLAALVIRTYEESQLTELAKWGSIPVINALTDDRHPCQVLTDIFTLYERLGSKKLSDQLICWIGDGNNMANTWVEAAAVLGFGLNLACPEGYEPKAEILKRAYQENPKIKLTRSPLEAAEGATAVNTDVFTSMGQESEKEKRLKDFKDFQVDSNVMAKAAPGAIFMHCLPAHPGEEATNEVIESEASVVFEEAENRLHVQKALLEFIIPKLI
ncbi:MAG: ornithine carbamoyltransferase [Deltaproteobacteria bacterium]|jgi:ornithine carbamoyltransferase|nr:ornithine carbamoyltransferase [Deltaproteobacteria bacterium]